MPQLRTIEIDLDIHKLIESERRSFDEQPYVALRRLLDLPETTGQTKTPAPINQSGQSWIDEGVELPHGTSVRFEYDRGKQVHEGKIINGKWSVNGLIFDSPSGAASALAITKKGKATKLNGWLYWKAKVPNETEWRSLFNLRAEAKRRRVSS